MTELSQWRSEVIERAINIEWLISAIICQHYLRKTYQHFLFEVLYDEYFSFALKRRILEKTVPEARREIQALNRINTIRNYFAHCNQLLFEKGEHEGKVPDPRDLHKELAFEDLYEEFTSIAGEIEEWLAGVFRSKGGVLCKERPT